MINRNDLIGLCFEGYFQRDPILAKLSKDHTEKIKKKDPKLYLERQKIDEDLNKKYRFEMQLLEYNPTSGIFIAKGKDFFGDSGLVGTINEETIKFLKVYAGVNNLPREFNRFNTVDYQGTISKPDSVITCGGSYQIENSINHKGFWRLDSKP
ncbi:MAG: hypothetical protein WCX73_04755 [Candidatus Pacearchaeota archaeon]|jgi:hypothetical protein